MPRAAHFGQVPQGYVSPHALRVLPKQLSEPPGSRGLASASLWPLLVCAQAPFSLRQASAQPLLLLRYRQRR